MEQLLAKIKVLLQLGFSNQDILYHLKQDEELKRSGIVDTLTLDKIDEYIKQLYSKYEETYANKKANIYKELMSYDMLYQEVMKQYHQAREDGFKIQLLNYLIQLQRQRTELLQKSNLLPHE